MIRVLPALLLSLMACEALAGPRLVINEVRQQQAEFVELHNPGGEALEVGGYRLAGDVSYTFPPKAQVGPGAFLVIAQGPKPFAREFPLVEAHAWLWERIRDGGGELRLYDGAGELVDHVRYGAAEPGRSWQRRSAGTPYRGPDNWAVAAPTPGLANSQAGALPALLLDRPRLAPVAGAGPGPTLAASVRVHGAPARVLVRWRREAGSWQEQPLALQGERYATAIQTGGPGLLRVRFVAEAQGQRRELTRAPWGQPLHRFLPPPLAPSKLPLYSLTLEPADLEALLELPGRERFPATLARVSEGRPEVIGAVEVNVRGSAWTRSWPKRSWTLRYLDPPAGPRAPRGVILRSTHNDATMLRETLSHELYRRAGVPCPRARLARVHLNGEFYGLLTEIELPDESFLERAGLGGAALYKAQVTRTVEEWCDGRSYPLASWYEAAWGKQTRRHESSRELQRFIEGYMGAAPEELAAFFARELEVERYLDYLAVSALLGHWDNATKNYYWCRDVEGSGKWQVIPWDLDMTWGEFLRKGELTYAFPLLLGTRAEPVPRYGWWNRLRDRFLSVPQLRRRYYERTLRLLRELLSVDEQRRAIMSLGEACWPDILADRQKWGVYEGERRPRAPFHPRHFFSGLKGLTLYVAERHRFLAEACREGLAELPPESPQSEATPSPEAPLSLDDGYAARVWGNYGALAGLFLLLAVYLKLGGTRSGGPL